MKKDVFGESIPKIEAILGYSFRDKSLLRQAFTRSSWCNEQQGNEGYQSNEVLEFFGDSVLSLSIVSFLLAGHAERYRHGIKTELGEGDFSNIKSKLSDKTNLSASTKKLGLEKYLLLGEGDIKLGIAEEPSVMEDLFESIVGAVYIDSDKNVDTVMKLVGRILDMSVYTDSRAKEVSPKNALQEWCADKKRRLPQPVYKTVSESGPDHKKTYERAVYIGEELIASASGKNQKIADALAASRALEILMSKTEEPQPSSDGKPEAKGKKNNAPNANEPGKKANPTRQTGEPGKKANPTRQTGEPGKKAKPARQTDEPKAKESTQASPKRSDKPNNAQPKVEKKTEAASSAARPKKDNGSKGSPRKSKKADTVSRESESAAQRLKRFSAERSVAGPEFRDLGMVRTHLGAVEYRIECSFMGKRAVAQASTRQEARERAAEIVADLIPKK